MFDRISKGLWWDRALTLVEGCTPVSPGCDNCWSAAMANRFDKQELFYPDDPQYLPLTTCGKFNGRIVCRPDRLDLPLKVKKPTVWAVWNDLFHEDVVFGFVDDFFGRVAFCKHHIFIILTKRPEMMQKYFNNRESFGASGSFPWPHIWLGVTAENQEQADKRIPILLQIPAAVRFVSVEPMLGPVDLTKWLVEYKRDDCSYFTFVPGSYRKENLNWVICGCESGHRRRITEWSWIISLKDQCEAAQVLFFLKQAELGGKVIKAPYKDNLGLPNV